MYFLTFSSSQLYPGSHATSNSAFLSAASAKLTESSDYYLGTTVDQVAAKEIGQDTKLPSLELAMDMMENVGQCDNGYACVYQNNLSWSLQQRHCLLKHIQDWSLKNCSEKAGQNKSVKRLLNEELVYWT